MKLQQNPNRNKATEPTKTETETEKDSAEEKATVNGQNPKVAPIAEMHQEKYHGISEKINIWFRRMNIGMNAGYVVNYFLKTMV